MSELTGADPNEVLEYLRIQSLIAEQMIRVNKLMERSSI